MRVSVDAFNAVNFSIRSNDANTFWLRDDGSPIQPGEGATRPALAATLRRVAREGASVIYTGEIANNIVTEVNCFWSIFDCSFIY